MATERIDELIGDSNFLADRDQLGFGDLYNPHLDTSSPMPCLDGTSCLTPSQDSTSSPTPSQDGIIHLTSLLPVPEVNETYQAPGTPSHGTIPLKYDETPPTSTSSLGDSDHPPPKMTEMPKSKPFSKGSKGKTRVSSGSSKKQKNYKTSSKSPVVTALKTAVVAPEEHRGELPRVPPVVAPFPNESSLDTIAHKRKRGPRSSRKKPPPKTPAPRPPSPPRSNGSLKSNNSMASRIQKKKHERRVEPKVKASSGKKPPPKTPAPRPPSPHRSNGSLKSNKSMASRIQKKKRRERRVEPKVKTYVEKTDEDVILGRGGESNHHPGNKPYLQHVQGLKMEYKALKRKEKKPFTEKVVKWVQDCGGRFLKRDDEEKGGSWYVVTDSVARLKVSQALRDGHTPEGEAEKNLLQRVPRSMVDQNLAETCR